MIFLIHKGFLSYVAMSEGLDKKVFIIGVKVMQKETQQNKTILVTGATGRQGGAVVRSLSPHGWKVRALVRDPAKPSAQRLAKSNIELVQGDLFTPASLEEALRGYMESSAFRQWLSME